MANNKVVLADGTILLDLTGDTVNVGNLGKGATAHNAAGDLVIGAAEIYTDAILGQARLRSTIVWRET